MGQFSDTIYTARVTKRLTLREVASAVGSSAMYLSQLENGIIPIKSEIIPKLAKYYNLDQNDLESKLADERKENALTAVSKGDFKTAFAAARKSDDISKALLDLLKQEV